MAEYPMIFRTESKAGATVSDSWPVTAGPQSSTCSIPPEFDGPGGAFSPEDYFALALANCFLATFKVYANASRIAYHTIEVRSELQLEKGQDGLVTASKCRILVRVTGAEQPARVDTILRKVSRSGILLNSVKTELEFQFDVEGK